MAEYFLSPHVHFCCRGDAFVFLDLKQDDYTLVNGNAAAALKNLLSTRRLRNASAEATVEEPPDALKELMDGGLLTTDRSAGRGICPAKVELALEPLIDPEAMPKTRLRSSHVFRFITACTTAAARLRWGKIDKTVKAAEERKRRHSPHTHFEMNKARELTAVFLTLRSLFPRSYLCLFDSLALLEFLARFQVYPTWVFGVKLEPWAAHCWVQEGQFIFNEGVEEAAGYTPIMAV